MKTGLKLNYSSPSDSYHSNTVFVLHILWDGDNTICGYSVLPIIIMNITILWYNIIIIMTVWWRRLCGGEGESCESLTLTGCPPSQGRRRLTVLIDRVMYIFFFFTWAIYYTPTVIILYIGIILTVKITKRDRWSSCCRVGPIGEYSKNKRVIFK